jgi:hypothetical protein
MKSSHQLSGNTNRLDREDDCYADLHPDITIGVKFYAARVCRGGEAVAVIRQRDRSDHDYPDIGDFPDIGQQMTWRLWWQHTTMLVEEAHGGCDDDLAEISREEAGQIAAERAARCWPPDAARLPWVARSIRRKSGGTLVDAAYYEDLQGRLFGLLILLEDRLGSGHAGLMHHFIEVGEYGLALEEIAGVLAHARVPVTDQERDSMLALAQTMKMDDLVARALGSCPRAG